MSFKINIPVNLNQSSLKNTDKLAFGQKLYFLLKNVSKSIPWFKVTTLSIIIHAQYWGGKEHNIYTGLENMTAVVFSSFEFFSLS